MQLYETFPLAAVISRVGVPTDMMKRHRRREKVEEKRNFPPSPSVKKRKEKRNNTKKTSGSSPPGILSTCTGGWGEGSSEWFSSENFSPPPPLPSFFHAFGFANRLHFYRGGIAPYGACTPQAERASKLVRFRETPLPFLCREK